MKNQKLLVEKKFELSVWVEKYRVYISAVMVIMLLSGGIYLSYNKVSSNPEKLELEEKIAALEEQQKTILQELEKIRQAGQSQPASKPENQTEASRVQNSGSANSGSSAAAAKQTNISSQAIGKVNINSASASVLDSLPGIGPTYAQRIIDYRNSSGGFKNIDEIKNVKGIGDKTFEKFKDLITI